MIDLENLDPLSLIDPFLQSSEKIIDQSGEDLNLDQREYFVIIINEDKEVDEEWEIKETGDFSNSIYLRINFFLK